MKRPCLSGLTPYFLCLVTVVFLSCSSGGGGGAPDVEYKAEMQGAYFGCSMNIQYLDEDGFRHFRSTSDSRWVHSLTGHNGMHLELEVRPGCGEGIAMLYINGDRVCRVTSFVRAEINGYLVVDSEGNASFVEQT